MGMHVQPHATCQAGKWPLPFNCRHTPLDAFLVHQVCLAEVALQLQVCCVRLVKQRMVPADVVILQEQEHTAGVWEAVSLHST
jgi:hypothetical protein